MPHLDEGIIHAWLDGALTDQERTDAEAHAADCEACSAAVAEARGLVAASTRILSALDDVPAGAIPVATRRSEGTMAVGAGRKARVQRWMSRPMVRAAAALLLVTTGTYFVASREQAKRELNVASDRLESTGVAAEAGAASSEAATSSSAEEVAVLEKAMPPTSLPAPARAPARNRGGTRSSSTGVTGGGANQAAADAGIQQRTSDDSRRELPPMGRPGSVNELSAKGAGQAASLSAPAAAGRDAASGNAFAGCYEIRLGAWTPALALGSDSVYITPPRRLILDTLPAAPSSPSSFRIHPVLDTPGRDHAYWLALGADSLRVGWTTGLSGLTMHLRLENETLSGVATTFWNFDRRSQQAEVAGNRVACQ